MYPSFLGIGAQKAGTSWLHSMLSLHDELWLPHLKELHYFDRKFPIKESGLRSTIRPDRAALTKHVSKRFRHLNSAKLIERLSIRRWADLLWESRYLLGNWTDEWYASLFEPAHGRVAGEITPAYSCLSEPAIAHIHSLMPDARLIFLMRDPIERAWSHARMDLVRSTGREMNLVTEANFIEHIDSPGSRLRGNYIGTVSRWSRYYPSTQLFVGYYDEITACPADLLLRIFRFLGVTAADHNIPRSALRRRINEGVQAPIPRAIHRHLARTYVDDLRSLAQQYPGYPQAWLSNCEQALND